MTSFRLTPTRVVLYLLLVAAGVLAVMAGITVNRRNSAEILRNDRQFLVENLAARENIEQEQLTELENELQTARDTITEYQDLLVSLGSPYPIFSRTKVLSTIHQVEILKISREGSQVEETPVDLVQVSSFHLELGGTLSDCINLLEELEDDSQNAFSLQEASFLPEENSCSFRIQITGLEP